MFKKVNELDEAALRLEFRKLYKEIGLSGMTQVMYGLIMSTQICMDIVHEEIKNEKS